MPVDSDYEWLKTHLNFVGAISTRKVLAQKVSNMLSQRIGDGRLPYTMGVFGGWGTGKTTFLALLAEELDRAPACKIVYFNSWKYAGFMEIVPALIYKILQYGIAETEAQREQAAKRVLLALGKKYSDQIGDWAKRNIGINVVELFKDAYDLADTVEKNAAPVSQEVIRAYYTQVDKAQDELRKALGTVIPGKRAANAVVVLIDELDRCDPDEAFNVIKQMRVLFGMRDLPVAFVVCANPDPIGLAIKHRYGLDSELGDYEARRILEKFVDSYKDLAEPAALGPVVQAMWKAERLPWMVQLDEANVNPIFGADTVMNATAFDAISTAVPLFSNLRVLYKSFEYVRDNTRNNRHFLWTKWFLEIAKQIDPNFRRDLGKMAGTLQEIIYTAYSSLQNTCYEVHRNGQGPSIVYQTDKGRTLFAILRSFFWEHAKEKLSHLERSKDPEERGRAQALAVLLAQPLRVDFVVLLSLLPFERTANFEALCKTNGKVALPELSKELERLDGQFGYELANT